jgi:hypothetical protein
MEKTFLGASRRWLDPRNLGLLPKSVIFFAFAFAFDFDFDFDFDVETVYAWQNYLIIFT